MKININSKSSNKDLNFSEEYFNTANVIAIVIDVKGNISLINEKGSKILGYKSNELIGKNWFNTCLPENDKKNVKKIFDEILKGKIKNYENYENFVITKKGEIRQILWRNICLEKGKVKITGTISFGFDITESKKKESDFIRINRNLHMANEISKMLISAIDEKKLLYEACRIAVEIGGYKMAWIGFVNHDKAKTISSVSNFGFGKDYVKKAKLTWKNDAHGQGPGGVTVRTGKPVIIYDISKDKSMIPWRANAIKNGYRSVIGLPLKDNGNVFGVILIYSDNLNIFCKEEINLLNGLANDLSFGITTHRVRDDAFKLKTAVETSGEVVYITDHEGIITYINKEFTKLYGYNKLEVVNKVTPRILKSGQRNKEDYSTLWKNLLKGKIVKDQHVNKTKKGNLLIVESILSPIIIKKGEINGFLAVQRDITENKKLEDKLKENERLVSNVNSIMLKWTPDGKISFINNYGAKIFGYRKNELIGKDANIFVPKKESGGRDLNFLIGNITKHPKKYLFNENENIKKDGKRFWVAWTNKAIVDKNGKLIELLAVGSNISKLKKTREKLIESGQRFKNIFEYSAVGVSLISIDGHWMEVNNALCKITGYSHKELLNFKYNDITYPDDFKKGINAINNLLSKKINHAVYEKRYIHKNGHIIWVNLSIALVSNYLGQPIYFVTHTEDITHRKEIEIKLSESEYFFKESQKAGSIGSYKIDYVEGFWESSDVLNNIYGIKKDYTRSIKGWLDIIHPDDRKMMNKYFNKDIILKHKQFNKEYRIIRKSDHKIRWVNVLGKVYFSKDGKIISIIGTIQDITERKEVEEKFRVAEEKFRRLFEAAKDSILLLDAETGEITDSNPFIQDLLGYSAKELIGTKIFEISPFKDIIENKEKFIELQKKGYVYYNDLPLKTKSGIIKQVEFVSNVYLVANKKVIQCNIRDITERIKEEKELDQAKNEFLSIASHQLRTPLSATKWVLETLFSDTNPTEKQKEKYEYLKISNERLINLVNRLLNVSRIESGKLVVNKKYINLDELINNLVVSFKTLADRKNKIIKINVDSDIKRVFCDPLLIHEILENLISNAIDYSPVNSQVITINSTKDKNGYILSVHNDGFINSTATEKIKNFSKFVRGEGSVEVRPEGSGLGLYITKKLSEIGGGKAWVESKPNVGTTFYVSIINKQK
ncbi:MAG TPA: PAS domain S-box protein [Candidatus Paceibacterota bacterium]